MKREHIPCPKMLGEYVHIYRPLGDTYRAPDAEGYQSGAFYEDWVTNDFSILRDGDDWHMVGITHPRPEKMVDAFDYEGNIHDAEFQLFHATATAKSFADLMKPAAFEDEAKILAPDVRPEEPNEIWAPHLMKWQDGYRVIYSPQAIRAADSTDWENWTVGNTLFYGDNPAARDPFVYEEDGAQYLLYVDGHSVLCRISRDGMRTWEEPFTVYECLFKRADGGPAMPESPFLMKRGEYYYLLWCLWDGYNGCYDNRTFVFAAKDLRGMNNRAPLTVLPAHAPEIVTDGDDTYMLSVFYPENGISAVRLDWE